MVRKRVEREGGLSGAESRLVERIRQSVRDLDAVLSSELRQVPDGRLLSLYLLLPKTNVEECRRSLAPLVEDAAWKVLVTGPWPPYHSCVSFPSRAAASRAAAYA